MSLIYNLKAFTCDPVPSSEGWQGRHVSPLLVDSGPVSRWIWAGARYLARYCFINYYGQGGFIFYKSTLITVS